MTSALDRLIAAGDALHEVLMEARNGDGSWSLTSEEQEAEAEWRAAVAAVDLHPPDAVAAIIAVAAQPDGTVLASDGDTIERHAGTCSRDAIIARTCTGACLTNPEGTPT